jgi:DNA-binding transcriptional LysR family regulator
MAMTLVQLRHLIALAEQGSFGRAAQVVHLSQPALSRSIRALEDELQQPLFDRVGRRVELTALGRETLERARLIVLDADELRAHGQHVRMQQRGTLRIGLGSGPGALLVQPLLHKLCGDHPQIRLDIVRGGTGLLAQALRARALDALVVDARSLPPAPDLRTDLVREMRGAFMVRSGHALVRRPPPLSFDMLRPYPLASTPLSDEVARVLVERYGAQAHPEVCVTLRCDELSSLVDLVRSSDAVLLAVRAVAPDLVELPLEPALDATARFGLVTLARRAPAPALDIVRNLMRQHLAE